MTRSPRMYAGALVLAATLALAGCGDDPEKAAPEEGPEEGPSSSAPASTPASPTASPFQVLDGPLDRCGPVPAAAAEVGFEHHLLRDRSVGTIPAITARGGRTAVVLLHQTDGNGLCGWIEFATTLAAAPKLSVVAVDLCRYGKARCPAAENGTFEDADQTGPVELAVRHARDALGARRVVVLGASMGGSVALMAAATLPGVDSAIDLSGPVDWAGVESIRKGKELRVPVLVAMADEEGDEQVGGARLIVGNAPDGSEFLPAESGHGYELLNELDGSLTPIADRVLRWLAAG